MIDESGVFGVDWAAYSRQLIARNAPSPARHCGTVPTAASWIRRV